MKGKFKLPTATTIAHCIVKYRWIIAVVFLGLTIFSACMLPKTNVSYDLSSYLPEGSEATVATKTMLAEFGDTGAATITVLGVTADEANTIADELSEIEGVSTAMLTTYDADNSNALYTIMIGHPAASNETNDTMKRIVAYTDDYNAHLAGTSFASYAQRKEVTDQLTNIGIIIAALIFVMLLITSKSYFDLVPIILVFGVAALINLGTNFMLGTISYLSNSIALVLQLALSIDYSIILLHRFSEEREKYPPLEAVERALSKGIVEILSSSLTTIVGLCSLMFMSLGIGLDMGLSLSKGILISMASVILLMPLFLLLFSKLIDKTKHKCFVPNVKKFFGKTLKAKYVIAPLAIVIIVLSLAAQFFNTYMFQMNSPSYDAELVEVEKLFGSQNVMVVLVPKDEFATADNPDGNYSRQSQLCEAILEENPDTVSAVTGLANINYGGFELNSKMTKAMMLTAIDNYGDEISDNFGITISSAQVDWLFEGYLALHDPDYVGNHEFYQIKMVDLLEYLVGNDYQAYIEEGGHGEIIAVPADKKPMVSSLRSNFESENYARLIVSVKTPVESAESYALVDKLKEMLPDYYNGACYVTGETVVTYEMYQAFPSDNMKVTLATIGFLLLILLFTFRNLGLPAILLLSILGSTWMNFAIEFLAKSRLSFVGYILVSAIQMGATIDYAILLSNRFNDVKKTTLDLNDAMAETLNAVFPTIMTSGMILSLTGIILGAMSTGAVSNMGFLLGKGTAFSMIVVLFVLPSFLVLTDKFVQKLDFSFIYGKLSRKKKPSVTDDAEIEDNI